MKSVVYIIFGVNNLNERMLELFKEDFENDTITFIASASKFIGNTKEKLLDYIEKELANDDIFFDNEPCTSRYNFDGKKYSYILGKSIAIQELYDVENDEEKQDIYETFEAIERQRRKQVRVAKALEREIYLRQQIENQKAERETKKLETDKNSLKKNIERIFSEMKSFNTDFEVKWNKHLSKKRNIQKKIIDQFMKESSIKEHNFIERYIIGDGGHDIYMKIFKKVNDMDEAINKLRFETKMLKFDWSFYKILRDEINDCLSSIKQYKTVASENPELFESELDYKQCLKDLNKLLSFFNNAKKPYIETCKSINNRIECISKLIKEKTEEADKLRENIIHLYRKNYNKNYIQSTRYGWVGPINDLPCNYSLSSIKYAYQDAMETNYYDSCYDDKLDIYNFTPRNFSEMDYLARRER